MTWCQRESQTSDRPSGLCHGVWILFCVQWKALRDVGHMLKFGEDIFEIDKSRNKEIINKSISEEWENNGG